MIEYLEKALEEVGGERGAEELGARAFDGAGHDEGRGGGEERRGVGQQHPVAASQERATAAAPLLPAGTRGHDVPELGVGHVFAAELGEARVGHGHERHRRHGRHVRRRRRRVQEREPRRRRRRPHSPPPPVCGHARRAAVRGLLLRRRVRDVWWTDWWTYACARGLGSTCSCSSRCPLVPGVGDGAARTGGHRARRSHVAASGAFVR